LLSSDSFFLIVEGKLLVLNRCVETKHSDVTLSVVQTNIIEDLF
jgi:hypothetical protein